MNSKGLFAYNTSTNVDFSVTIRTGRCKGLVGLRAITVDVKLTRYGQSLDSIAIHKAKIVAQAKEMEPGKYTVYSRNLLPAILLIAILMA